MTAQFIAKSMSEAIRAIADLRAELDIAYEHLHAAEAERYALRADAERLRAMAAEWNRNRRNVGYEGMPIWDALCEAIGNDMDGDKMRAAIDAARKEGK